MKRTLMTQVRLIFTDLFICEYLQNQRHLRSVIAL